MKTSMEMGNIVTWFQF